MSYDESIDFAPTSSFERVNTYRRGDKLGCSFYRILDAEVFTKL